MTLSSRSSATQSSNLEVLWEDGDRIFCRTWREQADGDRRAFLAVLLAPGQPDSAGADRLAHEYALKDHLDSSWAAMPVELLKDSGRSMLLLEAEDVGPLDRLIGPPMAIERFLGLAVALSAALRRLHERAFVHRDIKPANILVDRAATGVWLTGFGIASRIPRDPLMPERPESIAGTLPYMAPEQTGRMNRSVDSRSDLYSLGVTFYEMLTGDLPFAATSPMEWIHCHIARIATPPIDRAGNIPRPISAIVMKLLAKAPEDRYQTALGLERDLRHCLTEWTDRRSVGAFPLGEHDRQERLVVPERLYGRDFEKNALLAFFDRVVNSGAPEFVLVSGYSGVGKSSVVNELQKLLVGSPGLFASGKCDRYKRDIPYATLAQAFRGLILDLLGQPGTARAEWRNAFCEALGPNGSLITQLIPELKLLIGEQPAVPDLPQRDEKIRFHLAFRRFLGTFARPDRPLALFIDDLQWIDTATLDLLEDLLGRSDVAHFMLVGAYRSNEAGSTHPLTRMIDAVRGNGVPVRELNLAPLSREDLTELLADSLHCAPAQAAPLAQLVHDKTAGNPFFAIQFISTLAEEKMLAFDRGEARWQWDLGRIRAKGYTDNVVDLMVERLQRLPSAAKVAVQNLACLGDRAEAATLVVVLGMSEEEVHAALWEAVHQELCDRRQNGYGFAHDRVREAAYSLIPQEHRAAVHLRIGRLLAAKIPVETRHEAIFEIVNQLNRGADLISSAVEREQLAEFNLLAGLRAKASTAYAAALTYFAIGTAFLPADAWERRHDLAFALELRRAECEFLTGALADAEQHLAALSDHAVTTVDRGTLTCLHIDLWVTLGAGHRAIEAGLDYLKHLGIEWSPHPTAEEARRDYDRIWHQIEKYTIDELIDFPSMTDTDSLVTLDVLTKLGPPAYNSDINLLSLTVCRVIGLSLARGNSDASAVAYGRLGMIVGLHFGELDSSYRLGKLSYELVERQKSPRFRCIVYLNFGNIVVPWKRHVKAGRDLVQRALAEAIDVGDLLYAIVCRVHLNANLIFAGDLLSDIQREFEDSLAYAQKLHYDASADFFGAQIGLARTLRGLTTTFGSFDSDGFSEERAERRFRDHSALALAECWYWVRKLQARFFAGDYESALDASTNAQRLLWMSTTIIETADYHFYSALARASICNSSTRDERAPHLAALAAHHRRLNIWARSCPENFEDRAALVRAEIARLAGRELEAERAYEDAIRSARANGFVQSEALANELAGRFHRQRGFDKIASVYLKDARDCYLRWGAEGKVRQLEANYPHVAAHEREPPRKATIDTPVEQLDLATVIKVSHAIASEMVQDKLVDTLMRTAVEQAGAARGLLILFRDGESRIGAEATTGGDTIAVQLLDAPPTPTVLPASVLNHVLHTRETVILDHASTDLSFADDPYIRRHEARSILCLPVMNQAKLIGILYLENNLAVRVFAPGRVAVLKLLAFQAAISLENTRLYGDLAEREAKIRRLVDANVVGIVIWDGSGIAVEANDAFLNMIGFDREDLIAGRIGRDTLTAPEWVGRTIDAAEELERTGIVRPYEKECVRKDGRRVPVLLAGAAFDDRRDQGVSFFVDLGEQKKAEAAARESERRYHELQIELAHVNRVVTVAQLSASIAHEINQPLAGIVMNASACLRMLAGNAPNIEGARETARRTIRDANRASDVITRLRALFSKKDARIELIDINEAALEIISLCTEELRRCQIHVQLALADDLPRVAGDRIQLQQVVLNLLKNASDAMSAADYPARQLVIKTARGEANDIILTVQDSGAGIDAANIERLFDAFYSTKPGGLGVGLSICRTIVERHGGKVWATAATPHGAIFQFSLPANRNIPA